MYSPQHAFEQQPYNSREDKHDPNRNCDSSHHPHRPCHHPANVVKATAPGQYNQSRSPGCAHHTAAERMVRQAHLDASSVAPSQSAADSRVCLACCTRAARFRRSVPSLGSTSGMRQKSAPSPPPLPHRHTAPRSTRLRSTYLNMHCPSWPSGVVQPEGCSGCTAHHAGCPSASVSCLQ